MKKWRAYVVLGRPSNLPTVWTNVLAGTALAGEPSAGMLVPMVATSLMYTGGMFLNDAFDRDIDRVERPDRPIPAGQVQPAEAFAIGGALVAAGVVTMAGSPALWASIALAAAIVLYDFWHKTNPLAPMVMGGCRALIYIIAGLAVAGAMGVAVLAGAGLLLAYVAGLTYVARIKKVGPTVKYLIAGISFLDAAIIATTGRPVMAALAAAGFFVTLRAQRWVQGT